MTIDRLSRRRAITGAAALGLGVPVLAACSGAAEDPGEGAAPEPGDPASEAPSGPGAQSEGGAPRALAKTGDIPEGGGKVFPDEKIVITQPSAGEFKAFTAVCTHQGCIVTTVSDNTIRCTCHMSTFSAQDGANILGPEPEQRPNSLQPLAEVAITVEGDQILPA